MTLVQRDLVASSTGAARSKRLLAAFAAVLVGLLAVGTVLGASTPVTNGYRDQAYGGGAFRPTSDKPQSKLWYTDESWFAGMFLYKTSSPPKSEFRIHRLDKATHTWIDTGVVIDDRDKTHGDYLWSESEQTLWVASAYSPTPEATDDGIKIFKYTFSNVGSGTYTPVAGFPITIPNTATDPATPSVLGGAYSVTIERDSSGRLWAVWAKDNQVRYSTSSDGGATWATPAQLPDQVGNPIRNGSAAGDIASVITFGSNVGVGWSDHDDAPTAGDNGYYFSVIAAGADPAVAGNWTLQKLPSLLAVATESADNHMNLKATSDGRVFMVGKTGKDTADCATNKSQPLIEFFQRTAAGVWSTHLVGTAGDCNTRPQVVISEQLNTAWVFLTSPNGGGSIYAKSAPLSGPEAFKFRGAADESVQRGSPFIRSATDTAIDDATTSKQPVTAASGIVVLANNILKTGTTNTKVYLHNEMSIAAADAVDPVGTLSINEAAPFTGLAAVVASVPATDAGSGPSLVRLSNSPTLTGDVLTTGTTFTDNAAIGWTLPAGDGVKTLYAQWRDAAGNWSTPVSDTITLDTTAPSGTVAIAGGAASTRTQNVTLSLTAGDGSGSGVASVLISNSTDFTGATAVPFAASVPWTLTSGNGTKTVHVKFVDALGNTSPTAVTDTISLDTVAPAAGTVSIQGGAGVVRTRSVSVGLSGVAGDATAARASNAANMTGAIAVGPTGSFDWTLLAGADGPRTVYVQWADAAGNWSTIASDSIVLDTVAPSGTVVINAGKAWTTTTAVSLTFPNTHGDTVQVRVGTSPTLTGSSYRAYTAGMTLPFTLPAGNGTKTVYAQFKDVGGSVSTIMSDTIGLDATLPTAPKAPVHKLSGPVASKINLKLTWSGGTDTGGSGFAGYVLRQQVDSGAWTTLGFPTAGSANVAIDASRNYRFQVASRDAAGNIGAYAAGPLLRAANYAESATQIKYAGSWSTQSLTTYMSGAARNSTTRSASATFTFTGNQVAWLSRKSTSHGSANVYIDGVFAGTVNLYSATTQYKQVVFTRTFASVGTHTLKIVVAGTAGHPRVTVDQFFVLR